MCVKNRKGRFRDVKEQEVNVPTCASNEAVVPALTYRLSSLVQELKLKSHT
jgi:hypothetical protein